MYFYAAKHHIELIMAINFGIQCFVKTECIYFSMAIDMKIVSIYWLNHSHKFTTSDTRIANLLEHSSSKAGHILCSKNPSLAD